VEHNVPCAPALLCDNAQEVPEKGSGRGLNM
jgi:hypothetical protein